MKAWLWRSCVAPRRSQDRKASSGDMSGGGGSRSRSVMRRPPPPSASATPSPVMPAPATRTFSSSPLMPTIRVAAQASAIQPIRKATPADRRDEGQRAHARQRQQIERAGKEHDAGQEEAGRGPAPARRRIRGWRRRQGPWRARDTCDSARRSRRSASACASSRPSKAMRGEGAGRHRQKAVDRRDRQPQAHAIQGLREHAAIIDRPRRLCEAPCGIAKRPAMKASVAAPDGVRDRL